MLKAVSPPLCLSGHPSNPKCRWDNCRIPHAGFGWRYGADSATPRWQPGQHWNQLCHDGNHRSLDTGGAGSVDPRRFASWRFGVHGHHACRASWQHNIRPYKQCGSGVAGADRSSDGPHRNRSHTWRPVDNEQPGSRHPEPGHRSQTVAGHCEWPERQPRALRANDHNHFLFQLRPASWDHRRHRSSHPGDCRVRRRVWAVVLWELQLPQPPAANPGQRVWL